MIVSSLLSHIETSPRPHSHQPETLKMSLGSFSLTAQQLLDCSLLRLAQGSNTGFKHGTISLNLLDQVDQPLPGDILRGQDLSGEGLGYDGYHPRQVGVVAAQHVLVVRLNQIRQKAVDVGRLVHILGNRQPREPNWKNLIHVHLTVVVLENLGDCADGVFSWVDVLRLSAVCLIYNLAQGREALGSGRSEARSSAQTKDTAAISSRLSDLGLLRGHAGEHSLEPDLLVIGRGGPGVLNEVIEDAKTQLGV